jgi:hypothetical protein
MPALVLGVATPRALLNTANGVFRIPSDPLRALTIRIR